MSEATMDESVQVTRPVAHAVEVADERSVNAQQAMTMVERAIDKGVEVALLERLVALQERIYDRDARSAFISALATFQAECPPIRKTRENEQFKVTRGGVKRNAKYAPLEEIDRVARPVATRLGLMWTWNTRVDDTHIHVDCRVSHTMGHVETTTVSLPYESKAGASPQQKYAIAQTYGQRYSLIAALGITTADDDTDGNSADLDDEAVITDEQAADLSDLIESTGSNRTRFLLLMGIEKLGDLPAVEFNRAKRLLMSKAKERA